MVNTSGELEDDEPSVHATPSRGTTKSEAAVLPNGKTLSVGNAIVTDETPFAIATVKEKTVGLVRERPDAVPPEISKSFKAKPVTGTEKVAVRGKFRPEAAPAVNTTEGFTGLPGKENSVDPESVREPNTPIVFVTLALIVPAPDGTTITRHALLLPVRATSSPPVTDTSSSVSDTADAVSTAKYTGDSCVVAPASGVTSITSNASEAASFPNGPVTFLATFTIFSPGGHSREKV
jgi:hypothetical protein